MDFIKWLEANIITILVPSLSAFLAWFFSRNREKADIKNQDAKTNELEAETARKVAETQNIALTASQMAVSQWIAISEKAGHEINLLREQINGLGSKIETLERRQEKFQRVYDFLIKQMERYNPEVAQTARRMLEDG